jgi:hypothetical protein
LRWPHVARLRLALCRGVADGRRDRFGQHRYPLCDLAATGVRKVELPARSPLVVASLNDNFRRTFLNGRGVTYGGGRVGDDDGRGCKTALGGRRSLRERHSRLHRKEFFRASIREVYQSSQA